MTDDHDAADDPYLATLGHIAAELTAIRRALEDDQPRPATDASPEFICRCGQTFSDDAVARQHAVDEHNAPPDDWRVVISEVDH